MTGEHIRPERITELAVDEAHRPGNGEARHLANCPSCAALLEDERVLTARLEEIAPGRIPPGFAGRAAARFAEAVRARNRRHLALALALLAAIGAGIALAAALAGWQLVGSAAALAGSLAALARAAWAIACSAPLASVAFAALLCVAALGGCWSLARLARDRRAAKYPAPPAVHPSGDAR